MKNHIYSNWLLIPLPRLMGQLSFVKGSKKGQLFSKKTRDKLLSVSEARSLSFFNKLRIYERALVQSIYRVPKISHLGAEQPELQFFAFLCILQAWSFGNMVHYVYNVWKLVIPKHKVRKEAAQSL